MTVDEIVVYADKIADSLEVYPWLVSVEVRTGDPDPYINLLVLDSANYLIMEAAANPAVYAGIEVKHEVTPEKPKAG